MFSKTIIICVIFFQYINGSPIESQGRYDVTDFLSSRIVGGVDAPEGFAPYMVALVTGYTMKTLTCGGSIITETHIVSAAHCIEPSVFWGELSPNYEGRIGSNYWNTPNVIKFKHHITHPGFEWRTLKNDIGILITGRKIKYSHNVAPISVNYDVIGAGVLGFVTGWGRIGASDIIPYRLQLLDVNTISPEECSEGIKQASQVWGSAPPVDANLELCTFHSKGHGMCNGDSGSALVLPHSREQIGLVAWGFPCAVGAPDVFVRISAFKDFIQSALKKPVHYDVAI